MRSVSLGRWLSPAAGALAAWLVACASPPAPVVARPEPEDTGIPWQEAPAAVVEAPRSGGTPENGWLIGGVAWKDTRFARRPASREPEHRFAIPQLIDLAHRIGEMIATRYPPAMLLVGDLSGREGGPLPGHNSHQNGRDIDVSFYLLDEQLRPTTSEAFLPFDRNGKHFGVRSLVFDERRNWALVEALLTDPQVEVRTIFLATWLRDRLLRYGIEHGASRTLLTRVNGLVIQPPNAPVHDDHFHVRISCPPDHRPSCIDHSLGLPSGLVSWRQTPASWAAR